MIQPVSKGTYTVVSARDYGITDDVEQYLESEQDSFGGDYDNYFDLVGVVLRRPGMPDIVVTEGGLDNISARCVEPPPRPAGAHS
jgi:hypothetical protein